MAFEFESGCDPQLAMAECQASGVRIAFRSRATAIEVDTLPTRFVYVGVPARPPGRYDLHIDGRFAGQPCADDADVMTVDMATGGVSKQLGGVGTLRFAGLPDRDKAIDIRLPYIETTELVELRTNAPVEPLAARRLRRAVAAGCASPLRWARLRGWRAIQPLVIAAHSLSDAGPLTNGLHRR
jgi:hypothetical protein